MQYGARKINKMCIRDRGKLSDVTRAVEGVAEHLDVKLNSFVTVADVNKVKMYMKNFGEFYRCV